MNMSSLTSLDQSQEKMEVIEEKLQTVKHTKEEHKGSSKEQNFSGKAPIPEEIWNKYKSKSHETYEGLPLPRGKKFSLKRHKLMQKEKKIEEGREQAARRELLHTEQSGLLEAADGFLTTDITQAQILSSADITTKTKKFDLILKDLGPYRFKYYRDGRHLALCGELGHLATFNWVTKKLMMEINVGESAHDVTFLHDFNTIAVAQKKWTSVYDQHGTEIHCLKSFHNVCKLDYLPYHFLLAGLSEHGRLSYVDVSLGKEVISYPVKRGTYHMQHNPYNGVLATGHSSGIVYLWTPNSRESVASILCHKAPLVGLTFDPYGKYMVTADATNLLKIWDARNLGTELHCVRAPERVTSVSMSQKGLLAIGGNSSVRVYSGMKDPSLTPYMTHRTDSKVVSLQFCNSEDVLGISQTHGFSSCIIPGSGEPNFDASEINPFSSKNANREALVKNLLTKIPTELITIDPNTIKQVNVPTLQEKLEAERALKFIKVPKINANPKYRMKGKGGSAQTARRKQIMKDTRKNRFLSKAFQDRKDAGLEDPKPVDTDKHKEKYHKNILDRFK